VGEYLLDDHWFFNAGDHPHRPTTFSAGFDVDPEYPLQALRTPYRYAAFGIHQ
jgi:hypothetical protein